MSDKKYIKATLIFDMAYRGGMSPENLENEVRKAVERLIPQPDVARVKIMDMEAGMEEKEDDI